MLHKSIAVVAVLAVAVAAGGCISIGGGGTTSKAPDGFVFRTADGGTTWKHAAVQLRPGANALSLANTTVTSLAVDPTDSKAMYAGTPDRGLFYSYTGGQDWAATLENLGSIGSIAVDPLDRCTVYVAIGSALHKTEDCTRSWTRLVAAGGKGTNSVSAIVVDSTTANRLYIGTALGEVHRSEDGGVSWTLIHKFPSAVAKLIQSPNDPATLYAAITSRGLWRSGDSGDTWADVNPREIKDGKPAKQAIRGSTAIRDLAVDYTVRDGLVVASDAGLWSTDDGGVSWSSSTLPVSLDRGVRLGKIAVSRTNSGHIYLTVGSRLASTQTGGEAWGWTDLPSKRPVVDLLWPAETDYLFVAFGAPIK
jgi:photosystem II stability/assembly factor-like uncharacterized protein